MRIESGHQHTIFISWNARGSRKKRRQHFFDLIRVIYSRWWCCCYLICRCASSNDETDVGSNHTGFWRKLYISIEAIKTWCVSQFLGRISKLCETNDSWTVQWFFKVSNRRVIANRRPKHRMTLKLSLPRSFQVASYIQESENRFQDVI